MKFIIRLQKHTFGLHQPLPHGTVGGLAKITARGVLEMCSAGNKGNTHIGDRRTGQHAPVNFFLQMGKDQPLPVQIKRVGGAVGIKYKAAAPLTRLQDQMHFCIMPQRFIMADALHGVGDRFPVEDTSRPKGDIQIEALFQKTFQYFCLYSSHQLKADLSERTVPENMQERIFLLQLTELW